jgi:hypothetical protein
VLGLASINVFQGLALIDAGRWYVLGYALAVATYVGVRQALVPPFRWFDIPDLAWLRRHEHILLGLHGVNLAHSDEACRSLPHVT